MRRRGRTRLRRRPHRPVAGGVTAVAVPARQQVRLQGRRRLRPGRLLTMSTCLTRRSTRRRRRPGRDPPAAPSRPAAMGPGLSRHGQRRPEAAAVRLAAARPRMQGRWVLLAAKTATATPAWAAWTASWAAAVAAAAAKQLLAQPEGHLKGRRPLQHTPARPTARLARAPSSRALCLTRMQGAFSHPSLGTTLTPKLSSLATRQRGSGLQPRGRGRTGQSLPQGLGAERPARALFPLPLAVSHERSNAPLSLECESDEPACHAL